MHTGRKKVEPVLFVLEELIAENIELFNTTINRKEINILFNSGRKTLVKADKEMINTVLRNIISNALKYTFNHGRIEIKINPTENNSILVTVKDSGIGISDNDVEKLFKIDSNFSTPGLENEKGTGLGLILCKEFIEKNNGQIWVTSESGQGAEFSFTLPFASN
jgi:signal transduction histidine kinase